MGILTKAAKAAAKAARAAAAAKRATAKEKKKAAEVAARAKAAKARAADKNKPKAKPSVQLRDKADDAARAKADKAAEGLKGSGESLSTKLRKEAKAKAAEACCISVLDTVAFLAIEPLRCVVACAFLASRSFLR